MNKIKGLELVKFEEKVEAVHAKGKGCNSKRIAQIVEHAENAKKPVYNAGGFSDFELEMAAAFNVAPKLLWLNGSVQKYTLN